VREANTSRAFLSQRRTLTTRAPFALTFSVTLLPCREAGDALPVPRGFPSGSGFPAGMGMDVSMCHRSSISEARSDACKRIHGAAAVFHAIKRAVRGAQ